MTAQTVSKRETELRPARCLQKRGQQTQLAFLIVEAKPTNIANNAFPASAIGGKMTAMNEGVELMYGRPVRVN